MDDTAAVQPSLADFETRTFGDVTLVRGDCLEVMPFLPSKSINLVFADLPYGVTHCAWDCLINMDSFWRSVDLIIAPRATTLLTSTQPFGSTLIQSRRKYFKYQLIWSKRFAANFAQAKHRPLSVHEEIMVFASSKTTYNPQMTAREIPIKSGGNKLRAKSAGNIKPNIHYKKKTYTEKNPTSILEFSCRADKRGMHPTQKPVALLEWLIRTYTNDGDTILDPVSGSATTAVAAMNVGNRKVICIEKDPTYFEIMTKRVAEHFTKMEAARAAV